MGRINTREHEGRSKESDELELHMLRNAMNMIYKIDMLGASKIVQAVSDFIKKITGIADGNRPDGVSLEEYKERVDRYGKMSDALDKVTGAMTNVGMVAGLAKAGAKEGEASKSIIIRMAPGDDGALDIDIFDLMRGEQNAAMDKVREAIRKAIEDEIL